MVTKQSPALVLFVWVLFDFAPKLFRDALVSFVPFLLMSAFVVGLPFPLFFSDLRFDSAC